MKYLVVCAVALSACATAADGNEVVTTTAAELESTPTSPSGVNPAVTSPPDPGEPVTEEVADAIDRLLADIYTQHWDRDAMNDLADLGDIRVAWLFADLMRFYQTGAADQQLVSAFSKLTGASHDPGAVSFVWATNHLLASNIPSWDGYDVAKARIFVPVEERWLPFFQQDVKMDWRLVTWGGVLADDRPLGDNGPCNCIPALDYPRTTDARSGGWYDDDRVVFGIVVDDEAIALPKHQMEFHEMVNLRLGGRELGVPYCTLCASAQAYFVDNVPGVDRVVLRTSGLLQRSNKLMFDLATGSAIDTFTGEALTGPLAADRVVLEQVSVVSSTWGNWKEAHPDTAILAQDGGLGRVYNEDPLRGRDDDGPIFPVGPVDPRLPVQEKVVGVMAPDGTPIAFPTAATRLALAAGPIMYDGLTVRMEDGIRVYGPDGEELPTHEAFWFAWSQFHDGTLIWDEFGS